MAPKPVSSVMDQVNPNATETEIQQYYAETDLAIIQQELHVQGIDPAPTIANVRKLVAQSKLTRDPKRR